MKDSCPSDDREDKSEAKNWWFDRGFHYHEKEKKTLDNRQKDCWCWCCSCLNNPRNSAAISVQLHRVSSAARPSRLLSHSSSFSSFLSTSTYRRISFPAAAVLFHRPRTNMDQWFIRQEVLSLFEV
ncbi:hypothetical protein AWENTII_004504 [Aspergillus wentii]